MRVCGSCHRASTGSVSIVSRRIVREERIFGIGTKNDGVKLEDCSDDDDGGGVGLQQVI